jgi:Fe-S-cluster-containing dehydrogenase component/formate-dependent nitrite reductase membrane component NrfD
MPTPAAIPLPLKWAKVIDQTRCIGCHACSTACKSENEVPLSVHRTYVKNVDIGVFPTARRAFQVTRCNQCENPPCVTACPTSAMFQRKDGIVDFDKDWCIGCKACIAACPYDAIFINPEDHTAEKCNMCAHRLEVGLEPACVVVCPTQAILVGDMNDPSSKVAGIINREVVAVRRPEKDTRPKLFYKGAHSATLDPLAARRPTGGIFMWSEQTGRLEGQAVTSGTETAPTGTSTPTRTTSSAAAVLSYDIPHNRPWDWRVSAYTWTKGISAGVYLVAALLVLFWNLPATTRFWSIGVPVISGIFLALTGALLVWDLKQPTRFYYLFLRPQWKSWLVRGAVIITGYGGLLALHFYYGISGEPETTRVLLWAGVPLAVLTAVYTAYLFAQAKARDLWQNPLLPAHFVVQSIVAGSSVLALVAPQIEQLLLTVAGATLLHLLLVLGDVTLTHGTAHARLAAREITHGEFQGFFIMAVFLSGLGLFTPWTGVFGAVPALFGLLAWEHAHVQAGQSVPLA